MDRFPVGTRRLGDDAQVVVGRVGKPDVGQRRGQAHRFAEVVDLADDRAWPIAQEEPGECPDRHLLAVVVAVGCGQPRQAVVDRVRSRQPGALEASPLSRVFASTTWDSAGVTTFSWQAIRAATPCSRIVS